MEEIINNYPKIIGSAVIVIKAMQKEENQIEIEFANIEKNIPKEVVIMQLKRFVKNLKNEYFSSS